MSKKDARDMPRSQEMVPRAGLASDAVPVSEKGRLRHYFCHTLFTLKLLDFGPISESDSH